MWTKNIQLAWPFQFMVYTWSVIFGLPYMTLANQCPHLPFALHCSTQLLNQSVVYVSVIHFNCSALSKAP